MSKLPENFYIRLFRTYKDTHCFYMPTLKLEHMDITICLEGEMTYYIDDERVKLSHGDAIIIAPGCRRKRYRSAGNVCYASFNIVTPPDWMPENRGVIHGCVDSSITYLLQLFKSEWLGSSPQKRDKCNALFTYIYYKLGESVIKDENKHISSAKKYIAKNLFSTLSLSLIAAEISITPQHLSALFKKHLNKTVIDYINEERLSAAKSKILSSKASLCEIAESCGFSSYNYFTSLFKKLEGMSPSEYRKNFSNKNT